MECRIESDRAYTHWKPNQTSKAFDGIQIRTILESLLTNSWNEVATSETWNSYDPTVTWEDAENVGIGDIDEGEYEMISRAAAPVNMYSYVADIANSGIGYLYEDANGLISYGDADHRQDYLVANGYVNLDANHALAEGIRSTTRQGDIVNDLVINYKNNFGTSYTYTDQTSIDTYGLYARTINSLIDDDPDAQAVAERFVTFRSTPKSKFDSITYALQNPELSDANRNSLLNVFMGMPLNDALTGPQGWIQGTLAGLVGQRCSIAMDSNHFIKCIRYTMWLK